MLLNIYKTCYKTYRFFVFNEILTIFTVLNKKKIT